MAKVYRAPLAAPEWTVNSSWESNDREFERYLDNLRKLVPAATGKNADLVGKVVGFGVADGKALYMVWRTRPLELVFINYLDGYQIPDAYMRGLRVADIRERVGSGTWFGSGT
jgi:hypothetical protein